MPRSGLRRNIGSIFGAAAIRLDRSRGAAKQADAFPVRVQYVDQHFSAGGGRRSAPPPQVLRQVLAAVGQFVEALAQVGQLFPEIVCSDC